VAFDIARARLLKVVKTQALMTRTGTAGNAGARLRLPQVRAPFRIAQDVHIFVAVQQKMH
jgi:hypothetical protein